jgi:hypothetical protein
MSCSSVKTSSTPPFRGIIPPVRADTIRGSGPGRAKFSPPQARDARAAAINARVLKKLKRLRDFILRGIIYSSGGFFSAVFNTITFYGKG